MNLNDLIHETETALSANKVRSGLTMLGIIIGISSVIVMLGIGAGAQNAIQANIQSLGANLIQVMSGAQRTIGFGASAGRGSAQTLTLEDADAILSDIAGVSAVAPQTSGRYQIAAKGTNTNTQVLGVTSSYTGVRNLSVADGSFISDTQNLSAAKVAVLGPTTQTDLFGDGVSAVGQSIRINKVEFKVIGITAPKGGSGFSNQDDQIYVPVLTAERYFTGNKYVSTISVQAASPEVMTQVVADITALLLSRHKIADGAPPDFNLLNQADIIQTASSITDTFTLLLASVAGISLIVGGIGIMNMMLTTVTERTREIGLRKAIGAKRSDINLQFLAEAIALTLVGGLVGVLLGWGVAHLITSFGIIETSVSLLSVLLSFGVSAVIGVVFGYYPARRASQLSPIDALRYE